MANIFFKKPTGLITGLVNIQMYLFKSETTVSTFLIISGSRSTGLLFVGRLAKRGGLIIGGRGKRGGFGVRNE